MKSFDVNKILRYSKNTFEPFGLWPKNNDDMWYNLKGKLGLLITFISILITLVQGIKEIKIGDYENGSFSLFLALSCGHATSNVLFLLIEKSKFYEIIVNLEDSSVILHEDSLDIYVQRRMPWIKLIIQCQIGSCLGASIMFGLYDLFENYKDLPQYLSFSYLQKHHNMGVHVGTWMYFIGTCIYCAYVLGAYEGLTFTFLSMAVIQLQILRNQITSAINSYPSRYLNPDEVKYYDKLTNQLLKNCVKRHMIIASYIKAIENKFTLSYLMQLLITLIATVLIGLTFILTSLVSADFFKILLMFIAHMMQLIFLCFSCHEIITQSEMILHACYMSNWYLCGLSVRKTLFIIMERSKKPLFLTSGKFTIISLQTLLILLKTSMSYFSVLKTLYDSDID